LIEEVKKCKSKAASFTGGDPLLTPDKVIIYAKSLKEKFGQNFFIHLYTPGREGSKIIFEKLSQYIDEIRFHPKNEKDVERMLDALDYSWSVGIEIPAVPGLHEKKFFNDYIKKYAEKVIQMKKDFSFLNINQLEISERNFSNLVQRGYIDDKETNYIGNIVNGSEEEANKLIQIISNQYPHINIHYCPAGQKDGVQLPNRLLHRAHSVMLPSDFVIEDWTETDSSRGLLIRGVIRLNNGLIHTLDIHQFLVDLRKTLMETF
ncbi:MAG: hypothetical protein ACFFD1_06535, partial [Candidatus Thorarchaeota archaeon]